MPPKLTPKLVIDKLTDARIIYETNGKYFIGTHGDFDVTDELRNVGLLPKLKPAKRRTK